MDVIGLIPARKGSKGIPMKNVQEVDGKPLVAYSIEAALGSKSLSSVWVSSDDEEVLKIANQYQVKIHRRPPAIATDKSPITDTAKDLLDGLDQQPEAIMLIQPTAPIRTGKDIDKAIELLENDSSANTVISVCAMQDVHPARMYWQRNNILEPILKEYEEFRRQEIPLAYYRNGSIYLVRTLALLEQNSFMVKPIRAYEMPLAHLLNIDEPHDLIIAQALIPAWKKNKL